MNLNTGNKSLSLKKHKSQKAFQIICVSISSYTILTSVFHASVLILTMHFVIMITFNLVPRVSTVKVAWDPWCDSWVDLQTTVFWQCGTLLCAFLHALSVYFLKVSTADSIITKFAFHCTCLDTVTILKPSGKVFFRISGILHFQFPDEELK